MRWSDWIRDIIKPGGTYRPYNYSRRFDERERDIERRAGGGLSGSNILFFVLGGFTMLLVMFFVGASMEAILSH